MQISEKDLADKVRVCRVSWSLENCVTCIVGFKHVGRVSWSLDDNALSATWSAADVLGGRLVCSLDDGNLYHWRELPQV